MLLNEGEQVKLMMRPLAVFPSLFTFRAVDPYGSTTYIGKGSVILFLSFFFSKGSMCLPASFEALPTGSEAFPAGSKDLPAGSEALPAGFDAFPASSEALPAAFQSLPAGSEALSAG